MNRRQLEHVIRAAAELTGETEIVVVDSQAILAVGTEVPADMLRSQEADLYPLQNPKLADLVEGAIGAGSIFEETFGYHADGIGPETAKLPDGWLHRATRLCFGSTDATGICPEPNDLAVSKLVSGRPKDLEWLQSGLDAGLFDPATIQARLGDVPNLSGDVRELSKRRLAQMTRAS
jgi:hypothetical protein